MLADRTVQAVYEQIAAHHDADCATGSVVQPDHYCRYPGTSRLFSVSPTSGAQSPWSPELNRTGIKVDPFVDGEAHTFQARELADRSWRIEVIGAWGDLGECRTSLTVEAGQFCMRTGTSEQFRVYAVDELIASDTRSGFSNGYAVLFSNPVAINDQVIQVGDLIARRSEGHLWRFDKAPTPTGPVLIRGDGYQVLEGLDLVSISIGTFHGCGLRADGGVVCWGENHQGQTEAPIGRFNQVSVGRHHSCGVRTDGSLVCWGWNIVGQAEAPTRRFSQVTTGSDHSCGLRVDGVVICWGDNSYGQTDAPLGTYTQIATGSQSTCGLRSDGRAVCWGGNSFGNSDAPAGQYTEVSVSWYYRCGLRSDGVVDCGEDGLGNNSPVQEGPTAGRYIQVSLPSNQGVCGLREDGNVICWVLGWRGQTDAPSGRYSQVSAGLTHNCGVRTDGGVFCWGGYRGRDVIAGQYSQVSASTNHTCGLRTEGDVVCWPDWGEFAEVPAGRYSQVSTSYALTCGLRSDGEVVCWGNNDPEQTDAPSGQFGQISAGGDRACGVRADGTVACWGGKYDWLNEAPEGQFSQISTGSLHACGVRADAAIACWGAGSVNGVALLDAPTGRFSQVSVSGSHSCAVRTDDTSVCWGANAYGQTDAPEGRFSQVSAGVTHSCGLWTDGSVVCWGANLFANLRVASERDTVSEEEPQDSDRGDANDDTSQGAPVAADDAEDSSEDAPAGVSDDPLEPVSGRIVAQRLADGRSEFGFQPEGEERILPRSRFFPANASVGRWLQSSPVTVDDQEIGRISARLLADGRIEFALVPVEGERILPGSRYFPANAGVDRWLRSSVIEVP